MEGSPTRGHTVLLPLPLYSITLIVTLLGIELCKYIILNVYYPWKYTGVILATSVGTQLCKYIILNVYYPWKYTRGSSQRKM